MKDYNARRHPISNVSSIINGKKLMSQPMSCSHKLCDVYCDTDWSTKWLLEDGKIISKIQANEWDGITQKHPWSDIDIESSFAPSYLSIIWTPTLLCNYSCLYCGCAARNKAIYKAFPSSCPELSVSEWISFFNLIKEDYSWGYLQTNGGEPLSSEATIPILKLLSNHWAINLVTNGSMKIMELVRQRIPAYLAEYDFGLSVTLSLHPSSKGFQWDTFLGKALMLQNEGYLLGVNFVGYPEQLYLYDYYKEELDSFGIRLLLQPWMGVSSNGFSGYSDQEAKFVSLRTSISRTKNILNLGEYALKSDFFSDINISNYSIKNNILSIHIEIKNIGINNWDSSDIKLGAQLKPALLGSEKVLKEFRHELLKPVPSNASYQGEFIISLDGIIENTLELILDMVYENKFWFSEQGAKVQSLLLSHKDKEWQISTIG
jgi:hypothetical protein